MDENEYMPEVKVHFQKDGTVKIDGMDGIDGITFRRIRQVIAELRNGEYDRPGGGYQYRTAYLTALLDVETKLLGGENNG